MSCSRGCCDTQAEHYRSIALPVSGELTRVNGTERQWGKDMPAYQRLRANGLRPRGIDGCARIEATANSPQQVEGTG